MRAIRGTPQYTNSSQTEKGILNEIWPSCAKRGEQNYEGNHCDTAAICPLSHYPTSQQKTSNALTIFSLCFSCHLDIIRPSSTSLCPSLLDKVDGGDRDNWKQFQRVKNGDT
ncbi:hypothetical protein KIN20_038167 [Parelaphostrongylus tenuis]|uniref:Uncharacterized protein n=1 Tax=Parelaphostrongylus tenuis TaxID=148309 RepID=A0AAD5RES2_PARTN|nr:hypothetical protein KIN20_038167 [Parelaphostrongylus tenuis]